MAIEILHVNGKSSPKPRNYIPCENTESALNNFKNSDGVYLFPVFDVIKLTLNRIRLSFSQSLISLFFQSLAHFYIN